MKDAFLTPAHTGGDNFAAVSYAPDKSSGHRTQQIDICSRFNVAVATAVADSMVYDKKERLRRFSYTTFRYIR